MGNNGGTNNTGAGTVQADPQKLLDTAVKFSKQANHILQIMVDLSNVCYNNLYPSFAARPLSAFEFLWAAWMNEFLGIAKADEIMGLNLGQAAQAFIAQDGSTATQAEKDDISTLKQDLSNFKSTFSGDQAAVKNSNAAASQWDPSNPNSKGS
jgi:hypothetical protein